MLLVFEDEDVLKPAIGAQLQWLNTSIKTTTNPLGEFELATPSNVNKLIVAYKNFATDTIEIQKQSNYIEIKLSKQKTKLGGITVAARKNATEVSYLSTIQLLKITSGELKKAACCNLSESFETTPSVDVSFTDAITGQKQIQMLGLATPYTLITQ